MSSVQFFRHFDYSILLEGQLQRVHQLISIEGLVNPQTGMVLNLSVVDEVHNLVLSKIKSQQGSSFDLLKSLKETWREELSVHYVALAQIEISIWPHLKSLLWSGMSDQVSVKYQIGCQFREPKKIWSGVCSVKFFDSAHDCKFELIDEEISSSEQILQKLKQKFPQAHSLVFTDEVMGQKWSLDL